MIIQRALEVNRTIDVCFADYEKPFDKVNRGKMIRRAIRRHDVDKEDINFVVNLYRRQTSNNPAIGSSITK